MMSFLSFWVLHVQEAIEEKFLGVACVWEGKRVGGRVCGRGECDGHYVHKHMCVSVCGCVEEL